MNEQRFTEKESLELISKMIQSTKKSVKVGSGNVFLLYGYCATALSVVVYTLITLTNNPIWSTLWFLMFVPGIIAGLRNKQKETKVLTYTDQALNSVWNIVGAMFLLTVLLLLATLPLTGIVNFTIMLPLSLIYAGIVTSITGVIIKEKWLKYRTDV